MKIYTKTGDNGKTSLIGGIKVDKNNCRIEAYGNIDELISNIGMLKNYDIEEHIKEQLYFIQNKLFVIGTSLAIPNGDEDKYPNIKANISEADIRFLENNIDELSADLPKIKNFIVPEGSMLISWSNIVRTVCRRTERSIVSCENYGQTQPNSLIFINRLSDYFFVLARYFANIFNVEEKCYLNT